jgi:hypothetical protein
LIFFPIHITLSSERKNAPIYSKEFSLKDGGHIDTRTTTTTDELSRDFEEQSAAAKRNRYAFFARVSILCLHSFSHFFCPRIQSDGLFERFSTGKRLCT